AISAMTADTPGRRGWKRKGGTRAAGLRVANGELVWAIDRVLAGRDVTFQYVPAHREDGDHLNAIADQAASDAAVSQAAAGTALGSTDMPVPDPAAAAPARRKSAAPRKRTSGSAATGGGSRAIKAKFPGSCPCGKPYAAGDMITKNGSRWGHQACGSLGSVDA
ncbi:ribonuclease HI, partial [Streptomyces sp. NPDC059558]